MNSPLINYDLLYSPETKKDTFKSKLTYQSPPTASTSLSNPLKDKTFNFLKSPISNVKPIFPSDFSVKPPTISTTHNIGTVLLNNNPIEKTKLCDLKPNSPQEKNTTSSNNLECFKVVARIRPLNPKEISSMGPNKKPNVLKTIVRLDETSVI